MNSVEIKYSELISDLKKFLKQQNEITNVDFYFSNIKPNEVKVKNNTQENFSNEIWKNAKNLTELNSLICNCTKCNLSKTRKKFVFGVGNENADIMFIGEAPGADEDEQGEPFVGRAGQLLNKIFEAIQFKREEIYICNILKCRPPNNRDPQLSEVELCIPYLWKQIEIVKPKILVSLGRIGAQMLLNTNDSLTKLREKIHTYKDIPLIVTYHPAALLRNPNWKIPTWEDVKKLRSLYSEIKLKND